MATNQQWLALSPAEFQSDSEQTLKGLVFHVSMSPYDIPQAVRGEFDEDRKRFVIEFRYISPEETASRQIDEHVILHVGENSGRLCGIEADVEAMNVNAVLLRIDRAAEESINPRLKPNYDVAKKIITEKARELWQRVPAQFQPAAG